MDEKPRIGKYLRTPNSDEGNQRIEEDLRNIGPEAVAKYRADQLRLNIERAIQGGVSASAIVEKLGGWDKVETLDPEIVTELKILEFKESLDQQGE